MSINPKTGLYREILTEVQLDNDPKFNTFSMTDEAYKTYINVGIWEDLASFDAAVGKYIQEPEDREPISGSQKGKTMKAVYMHDFEFKIRERVILNALWDRKDECEFGKPDLE